MKKWIPLLLSFSGFCYAGANDLVGQFSREFSANGNEADFVITQQGKQWKVVAFHADLEARLLTKAEKEMLFRRISWAPADMTQIDCVKFDMQSLCHLPDGKGPNDDGETVDESYFYYDPMSGLAKVNKQ